jgi:uridylate kinase
MFHEANVKVEFQDTMHERVPFKMRLVIRIGGSVVASPFNPVLMNAYVELLLDLKRLGHVIAAVVGGGSLSRDLIKTARAMGLSEMSQDEVAISVSRLMAQLLVLRLGKHGTLTVPTNIEDAAKSFEQGKIVVMGGLKPGMTTDTVAAMLAEHVNADLLVKATDVDGVFTRDPKKHKDAEKLVKLSFDDLFKFFEKEQHEAGIHQVLDPEAVRILQRKRIKTVVVNGFKPENVLLAVKGGKVGTLIS